MAYIKKILVPTDFSSNADRALEFAVKLATDCHATLHLLHVDDDPMLNAPTTSEEFRDRFEDRMATMLASLLADEQRRKLHTTYAIVRGDAAFEIVAYAESHAIDLIVVGSKGRSSLADLLIGSIANKVVHRAKCPVVTVKP